MQSTLMCATDGLEAASKATCSAIDWLNRLNFITWVMALKLKTCHAERLLHTKQTRGMTVTDLRVTMQHKSDTALIWRGKRALQFTGSAAQSSSCE